MSQNRSVPKHCSDPQKLKAPQVSHGLCKLPSLQLRVSCTCACSRSRIPRDKDKDLSALKHQEKEWHHSLSSHGVPAPPVSSLPTLAGSEVEMTKNLVTNSPGVNPEPPWAWGQGESSTEHLQRGLSFPNHYRLFCSQNQLQLLESRSA